MQLRVKTGPRMFCMKCHHRSIIACLGYKMQTHECFRVVPSRTLQQVGLKSISAFSSVMQPAGFPYSWLASLLQYNRTYMCLFVRWGVQQWTERFLFPPLQKAFQPYNILKLEMSDIKIIVTTFKLLPRMWYLWRTGNWKSRASWMNLHDTDPSIVRNNQELRLLAPCSSDPNCF